MSETTQASPVPAPAAAPTLVPAAEDDWLTGATACSIENGEDCEACQ